jgi:hypothetical protein
MYTPRAFCRALKRAVIVTSLLAEMFREVFRVYMRWQYGYTSRIVNMCFYHRACIHVCMPFERQCTVYRQVIYSCD